MLYTDKIIEEFKGSDDPYLGLGLIGGVVGGLGFAFSSTVIWGISGAIMAFTLGMYLFGKSKKVKMLENGIELRVGQIGRKKWVDFQKVVNVKISKERNDKGLNLIGFDLTLVDNWELYKYISLEIEGEKVPMYFSDSDFSKNDFPALIRSIQHFFLEAKGTPLQKLESLKVKTANYVEHDKKLWSELQQSLYEACKSVYQPLETLYSRQSIDELDANPEILFHTIKQGNVLVYFQEDKVLHGVKETDAASVRNLIAAAKENIEIVDARLQSHQEVLSKLKRLSAQMRSRERLRNVASKIDELQQKNIGTSINYEDLAYEAEVIAQFEQLTEHIHSTETLEKSLILKTHIELFKDKDEESSTLKEINQKLKG